REERAPHDVPAIFTGAEETGLYGARLAAEDGLLPRDAYVVSVEASRALPGAEAGRGIVVRAGDLHNTFSNEAERYLRVARERLAERGIASQRALLVGGTCEASSFVRLGWVATGIALPNVNYHNAAADGGFAPEIVRLGDLLSGIALSVEAALAAGSDADESWWPDVRVTPTAIRDLLRRAPSKWALVGAPASARAQPAHVGATERSKRRPTRADRRAVSFVVEPAWPMRMFSASGHVESSPRGVDTRWRSSDRTGRSQLG